MRLRALVAGLLLSACAATPPAPSPPPITDRSCIPVAAEVNRLYPSVYGILTRNSADWPLELDKLRTGVNDKALACAMRQAAERFLQLQQQ